MSSLDSIANLTEEEMSYRLQEQERRTLIITVGLPRSGKSTWARKQGHPIVCPDAIRLALHGPRYREEAEPMVWAIAKLMVRALFEAGHRTVILDACNASQERRKEWLSDEWDTRWQWITEKGVFSQQGGVLAAR